MVTHRAFAVTRFLQLPRTISAWVMEVSRLAVSGGQTSAQHMLWPNVVSVVHTRVANGENECSV